MRRFHRILLIMAVAALAACAPKVTNLEGDVRSQLQARAEQGDIEAQYKLGKLYCCGFGPGHDESTARMWLCRAAAQGYAPAQFELGQLYGIRTSANKLISLPQHIEYAHMWYSLAAAQGHDLAATYRNAMEQDMTPAQIARSREWAATPGKVSCG